MEKVIHCEKVGLKIEGELLLKSISLNIEVGETVAIVGPSGCGKTLLGKLFAGIYSKTEGVFEVAEGIQSVFVEQQDNFFAQSGMRHTYYSQRYEYFEGRAVPTVAALLKVDTESYEDHPQLQQLFSELHIAHLLDRQLLLLSNGERKRVQMASALLQHPSLFIFDQPFIGLDMESRKIVKALLQRLQDERKTVVIICSKREIPEHCSRIIEMKKGEIKEIYFPSTMSNSSKTTEDLGNNQLHFELPLLEQTTTFETIIRMRKVDVSIAERSILEGIDWEVKRNERWLLSGHNGSGKSTLLSLVTADNPHGYNKDLMLFDRMRGTGETVWDIKKKIGFVSPELHLYFLRQTHLSGHRGTLLHSIDCLSVVLSVFHEEIGFSSKSTVFQERTAVLWLEALGLKHLIKREFAEISLGEQRMVLLVRALIKNPPLLILDEPCQGIDQEQSQHFIQLLDHICTQLHTTMVYVTHAPEEIPRCITHRIELQQGKVIFSGKI